MASVELKSISKSFGGAPVLSGIELDVADGEFLTLVGASGCGKSTLIRIIAGLEPQTSGSVEIGEVSVDHLRPHERQVAMVFQSYALYPHMRVFANMALPLVMSRLRLFERLPVLRLLSMRRRRIMADISREVDAIARQLQIEALLDRRPSQLSGGQRQRVALGRAMVRQPAAFLMDEPLSNLDAALRVSMRILIKKLHRSMGTTFIYVTHDQAEAMTLADRITVMRNGIVQQIDTPDGIYNRPVNRFVAGFLGSPQMNFVEGEIVDESGRPSFARGEFRVNLDPELARGQGGRKVVLGLRAEDAEVGAVRPGDLSGQAVLVSPLGSEQHVNVQVGDVELIVRAPKEARIAPAHQIGRTVEARRRHACDVSTHRT